MRINFKGLLGVAVLVWVGLAGMPFAFAQQPGGLASEDVNLPGGMLLIAAYGALWAMVFGYVWVMVSRQKTLSRDLGALEARMDDVLGTGESS